LKNTVTPATGLLSPLNWAFDESVPPWPYDPQKAKRLLDEAGYSDPDGDGPRPRIRVSFKTTNIDLRRRIAEAFKEQLALVGVELEIRSYEWGTFYSDVRKGNFHLFSLAWVGVAGRHYFQLFHSDSVPPNGDNRGLYRNSEIDRLLEAGRTTVDPAQQLIYGRVQKLLAVDLPHPALVVEKRRRAGAQCQRLRSYPDGDFISLKKVSLSS
jgi:peptide/nickel transport system substrate-binding protein